MSKEIAQTIIAQINAAGPAFPRLTQLMGAKDFVALNGDSIITPGEKIRGGLMFRATAKPGCKVIVELTGADDYNVVVGRLRKTDWKVLESHEGVYCDSLGVVVADALQIA